MTLRFLGKLITPSGKLIIIPGAAPGEIDPFFDNVVLLAGFENTASDLEFQDESTFDNPLFPAGNMTTSTTDAKFSGNKVGQFPGGSRNTNYVKFFESSDFRLEMDEDWTIELFVRRVDDGAGTSYNVPIWFDADGDVDFSDQPGFGFFRIRDTVANENRFQFRNIRGTTIKQAIIAGVEVSLDTWHHLAVVNDGTTQTAEFFQDGISQGTDIGDTTALGFDPQVNVGRTNTVISAVRDWPGQMEEIRVTLAKRYTSNFTPPTGTFPRDVSGDSLFNDVVLLVGFDGSNVSTNLKDKSSSNHGEFTLENSAQISIEQAKFGTFSLLNDFASLPDSNDWTPDTDQPFTIEAFIYPASSNEFMVIMAQFLVSGDQRAWFFRRNDTSKLEFSWYSNGTQASQVDVLASDDNILQDEWTHVAVTRDNSNVVRLFVNGIVQTDTGSGGTIFNSSADLTVGTLDTSGIQPFDGWIDELRITKGTARYTGNFTPPTEAFPRS